VPLSEEEQRILDEMARSFYETDPAFAREVSSKTVYKYAGRNIKWAAAGFVLGIVVLVAFFAKSLPIGFLGFLIMLGSAFVFQHNVRRMSRAGWNEWAGNVRGGNLSEVLGSRSKRLRERFRRDEGESER
jgi:Flp pilus assembly protein TadB